MHYLSYLYAHAKLYVYIYVNIVIRRQYIFPIEGETNAGKSTFLNLLLGEKDLLTVKAISCTSVITRISYGTKVSVCVLYESGKKEDVLLKPDIEVNKQVEKLLYEHDLTLRETTERTGDRIVEVHLKIPSKILKVFEQFYLGKTFCRQLIFDCCTSLQDSFLCFFFSQSMVTNHKNIFKKS